MVGGGKGRLSRPAETTAVAELLNLADPGGMAFRYSGELPNGQDFMDFPALNKALSDAYSMVATTEDVLDHYAEGQADWVAYKQEIEAGMRAEFEADMRGARSQICGFQSEIGSG